MKFTCVVDNAVQLSSGMWGEHGLAYVVETDDRRILFDTGQSGTVLLHNLQALGIDPATLDAIVISHAHYDHTGGLPALLDRLRPGIPLFANADLFRERFGLRDDKPHAMGLSLSREQLAARLTFKLSAEPQEVAPGVWTSGEIRDRTDFEGRGKGHLMREEGKLVPDAYRDDLALVGIANDRLALLCGCCHAGLLNTLAHVERTFPQPIELIAGGLHLAGVTDQDMRRCGERLAALPGLAHVHPGHCTGHVAAATLEQALGPAIVRPGQAGFVARLPDAR